MKILFLNPPNLDSLYVNRDLMGGLGVNLKSQNKISSRIMSFLKSRSIRLPVMSLAYSATVAKKYSDVSVIDAANSNYSKEQTVQLVKKYAPDWIISATSISTLEQEVHFLADLKRQTGAVLGLTGDSATHYSSYLLEKYKEIDFIIRGDEPEFVINKILENQSWKQVKGIVYLEDRKVQDSGDPGTILDLDALPFPDWSLFPVERYRYFPSLRRRPFLSVLSSRGCPYGCIYCPYTSNQGLKYRFRSVQNVIDELVEIKKRYKVQSIQFRDPTFTLKKDRTIEICEGMMKHGLNLEWGCETRIDCLDPEMIKVMVASGLKGLNVGIESIDPKVIKNIKRGQITPDKIKNTIHLLAQNGVRVLGFFILGLPGEDFETLKNTLDFSVSVPLAYADFKIATPFPGTPLFEMAQKNKWIEKVDINQYTSYVPTMQINPDLTPEYLTHSADLAYKRFYMRPSKIVKEVCSDRFVSNLVSLLLNN